MSSSTPCSPSSSSPAPCKHVKAGTWPFRTELVLDDHLGPTDSVVACRECGRHYLLEMLDWRESLRVMRLAVLDSQEAAGLVHDLTRGSCDLNRATAQVAHLQSRAPHSPWLLLIDTREPHIDAVAPHPADRPVPSAGWRSLPCDGTWVDYARSNSQISNR